MVVAYYPTGYFSPWLKSQKTYAVYQFNNYPTVVNAISIITSFFGAALAVLYALRKVFMVVIVGFTICGIIMIVYDVPKCAVFFAFYIRGLAIVVRQFFIPRYIEF